MFWKPQALDEVEYFKLSFIYIAIVILTCCMTVERFPCTLIHVYGC